MKKQLLFTAALLALSVQQCSANTELPADAIKEIPCQSAPEPETSEETTIRLPLLQCLTRPRALVHCPAALAATALTIFKVSELTESLINEGWEGKKWYTINLLFEAIVAGYFADWFLKKFLKSCEEKQDHLPKR
jgi:hypothetical protein